MRGKPTCCSGGNRKMTVLTLKDNFVYIGTFGVDFIAFV